MFYQEISKKTRGVEEQTCITPFTRHTLCFKTTMCGSLGCNKCNSSLTDSILALCSDDNWTALTSLWVFSVLPNTTLESPAFAIYSNPQHIMPTKQHEPTEAICGLISHCFFTRDKNSSSVSTNALLIISADTPWLSGINSAPWKAVKCKHSH